MFEKHTDLDDYLRVMLHAKGANPAQITLDYCNLCRQEGYELTEHEKQREVQAYLRMRRAA